MSTIVTTNEMKTSFDPVTATYYHKSFTQYSSPIEEQSPIRGRPNIANVHSNARQSILSMEVITKVSSFLSPTAPCNTMVYQQSAQYSLLRQKYEMRLKNEASSEIKMDIRRQYLTPEKFEKTRRWVAISPFHVIPTDIQPWK